MSYLNLTKVHSLKKSVVDCFKIEWTLVVSRKDSWGDLHLRAKIIFHSDKTRVLIIFKR